MKLPSTEIKLPGGYTWLPQEVPVDVWQAHVLKHPLGVDALRRWGDAVQWNREGWDTLIPPVVTEEQRAVLVSKIVALGDNKQRCEVRELRGRQSSASQVECRSCEAPLIHQCAKVVAGEGIGQRYAALTEGTLLALADGVTVSRAKFMGWRSGVLGREDLWDGLVVMSVGRDGRLPIMRVSRPDGVRVDLYINGRTLRWRTTYRDPVKVSLPNLRWSFLTDSAAPDPELSLSDVYVVPRDWSNRHGT